MTVQPKSLEAWIVKTIRWIRIIVPIVLIIIRIIAWIINLHAGKTEDRDDDEVEQLENAIEEIEKTFARIVKLLRPHIPGGHEQIVLLAETQCKKLPDGGMTFVSGLPSIAIGYWTLHTRFTEIIRLIQQNRFQEPATLRVFIAEMRAILQHANFVLGSAEQLKSEPPPKTP